MTSLKYKYALIGIRWYDWLYLIPLFIFYPIINMFAVSYILIKKWGEKGNNYSFPSKFDNEVKWHGELIIIMLVPIFILAGVFLAWIAVIGWAFGASDNTGGCPHYRNSVCDCKP